MLTSLSTPNPLDEIPQSQPNLDTSVWRSCFWGPRPVTPARIMRPPLVHPSPSPNRPAKRTCLAPRPAGSGPTLKGARDWHRMGPSPCTPQTESSSGAMLTPRPGLISADITADCDKLELPQGGAPGPSTASSVSPCHPYSILTACTHPALPAAAINLNLRGWLWRGRVQRC